jgi:ketosteroid isomerase-like protein
VSDPSVAGDSDPDVALVLRCYEAYARGDIEQAVAPLHPEVEWVEPDEFPNGGRRQGPAAVADYLRSSRSMWAELVSEPTPYRRGDKIVIVHHVSGRAVDGSTPDITVADVFTVKDGQVVRMKAYADPAEALALYS